MTGYWQRRWQAKLARWQEQAQWRDHWMQWRVHYQLHSGALSPLQLDLASLPHLPLPDDCFHADPFVVWHQQCFHVFFEVYSYHEATGHLAVQQITTDGQLQGTRRIVLQLDTHLSYPQVFSADGQWWMVPETSARRTVELWRCVDFPDQWTRHQILLDQIDAVDATLWQQPDGLWRMLATLRRDSRKYGDKLYSFSAPDLYGPWQIDYQGQPVARGMLSERPGGALFRDTHQQLIRPVQDSLRRYGEALEFRIIRQWDSKGYQEQPAYRLEAPRGLYGIHTFNQATSPDGITLTAVDLIHRQPSPKSDC